MNAAANFAQKILNLTHNQKFLKPCADLFILAIFEANRPIWGTVVN